MKQVLLEIKTGAISVEDVPQPLLKKGVIVQNHYSLISAGTEASIIRLAEKSMLGKARDRPDLAKQVIDKVKTDGMVSAYQQVRGRLDRPEPLGYSCAGIVTESNIPEFSQGDMVACAGAGYASHAEYVYVPRNLCVKVPEGVRLKDASFTAVGSIALQGVRNAGISIGERVVVIGLGLIGLLTVQILKAAGCRVLGVHIDQTKLSLAKELGADVATNYENITHIAHQFSPFGADAVIITAGTSSNEPVTLAGDLVREHGRVVAVGMVGMELPREKYYEKEAEFIVSRSYGLGRYDRSYEEKGIDYPILVRWTEQRNMEAFLSLIAEGRLNPGSIISHEFSIDDAEKAYGLIREKKEPFIGIVLNYHPESSADNKNRIVLHNRAGGVSKDVRKKTLGCIGAGVHASSSLYHHLPKLNLQLRGIATATGLSAFSVAKKFGFEYATTDYHDILDDDLIDAVLIATRNDLHAPIVIEALNAGKDVFVEKPLATNIDQLNDVINAWKKSDAKLQVGFNRRYSGLTTKVMNFFEERSSPMVMQYRVNAGPIPANHWVHDAEQGGSMLITECCHFIDFFQYVAGSPPVEVFARSIETGDSARRQENALIFISLEDGSVGAITYTTMGDKGYSKELVEIFCDQKIASIQDFRALHLIRNGKETRKRLWFSQDKGFFRELQAFTAGDDRGDLNGYVNTTLTSLLASKSMETGKPIELAPYWPPGDD